jgi:hypothetical protein
MAADLDAQVEAFRTRPLAAGPYTFVAADALVLKVREGGRVVNVHALLAVGVNADGHREVLGLQVTSAEDGAGWLGFFAGPDRPRPVRSAAGHLRCPRGLTEAIGATLPGASWQRSSVNIGGWRDPPAGSPPPSGENLGSVTFEVQRHTSPSRRWRASTGQWESCFEHLDERPAGPAEGGGHDPEWTEITCSTTTTKACSAGSTGAVRITSCVWSMSAAGAARSCG